MSAQVNAIERKEIANLAESLYKSTHFTREETEKLLYRYREMTKEEMDRSVFRDLLHSSLGMTDDFFMDRLFRAFDKDSDSRLNRKEWVQGMSVILRGTLDEKMEFCFNIYDLKSAGYILREEMFHLLKSTMVKQPTEEDPEEGIKDLVEIMMKRMDADNDGKVTLEDFKKTVSSTPLLLESFGTCLPETKVVQHYSGELFDF
jgi:Ca2+-binding EF-hand superfamily protein